MPPKRQWWKPVSRFRQGMTQRGYDQPAYKLLVAETYLRFSRVNVDIHVARRHFQVQRQDGVAIAGQEIRVGPAYRASQQTVLHRTSVDK